MHEKLEDEIRHVLARMDNQENHEPETGLPAEDTASSTRASEGIQDIYVLIVREQEPEPEDKQVVESDEGDNEDPVNLAECEDEPYDARTLYRPEMFEKASVINPLAIVVCLFGLFFPLSCIALQLYLAFHPFIATLTIIPTSQQVALTGTLQLGRVLSPLAISQSQTVPTTGKGHQDAKAATGFITFYNGRSNSFTLAAGTTVTGASGIEVITNQDAIIPAGTPPTYGETTVPASALVTGRRGNISVGDINSSIAIAVFVKNLTPFHGGQEERDFSTVSKQDINKISTRLIPTLTQSIQGALQGQLIPREQLHLLPCTPTVTSDHPIGQEATLVKVTVSATCSAVAYTSRELVEKATALLFTQARQKLGTGYSLIGDVEVSVKQATVTRTSKPLVFFSFFSQGTWVYALNKSEQQHIKQLIAGKTKQAALHILLSVQGIERASLAWSDETRLPKDSQQIHIVLLGG